MKKSALRLMIIVIVAAALIFLFSFLLSAILLNNPAVYGSLHQYILADFVDNETTNVFLGFMMAIPISLTVLAASAVYSAIRVARRHKGIGRKPHIKQAKKKQVSRFPRLTAIDKELKLAKDKQYYSCSLEALCKAFREFAASKLGLYYDIKDIRRFIAGMGMSKIIILRGMSGTGKTSLAYAAGEFFDNPSTVVPIQPMWKERSDILGYFNEFTKRFNETSLLCKLYEAGGKRDVYITVLDEVNIARIEYYFAEFLSLLELPEDRRYIDVVSDSWNNDPERLDNGRLLLPKNMWFIGTANNDDSTFAISDKVYDRAAVIDLDKKSAPFNANNISPCHISYQALTRLFEQSQRTYSLSKSGQEKLEKIDAYLTEVFGISFGNRIKKQIEQYVPIMLACGGTEDEALDDILARKVLRKLEQLSPAYVKSQADALIEQLNSVYNGTLLQSTHYIEKLASGF